jgi:hypothetical protein
MIRLEHSMKNLWDGVKGIVRKNDHILVLVKPNGTLDLPGAVLKMERQLNLHYSAKLMKKLV